MANDFKILKEYIHESLTELKFHDPRKKSSGFFQDLFSGLKSKFGIPQKKKSKLAASPTDIRARAARDFDNLMSDWIADIEVLEDTELDSKTIDELTNYAKSVYARAFDTYRGNLRKTAEMTKRALDIQYAKLQR